MSLIGSIRGLMGLTGPAGPAGVNGVVGFFVATLTKKTWTLAKGSSALTANLAAGTANVNIAGWYVVNWSGGTYYALNSTITLTSQGGQCVIAGPLT